MSEHPPEPPLCSRAWGIISSPFTALHSLLANCEISLRITTHEANLRISSGSNYSYPSTPTTPSFPQFKKLPPEVRAIIWEYSFGEPRIFRTKPPLESPSGILAMVVDHKPPRSSQACKEARHVSQVCGSFLFGAYGGVSNSLWFNPSKDILYWNRKYPTPALFLEHEYDLKCIENIAVDWPGDDPGLCSDLVFDIGTVFPYCKRVMVVMEHRPLPHKHLQFFPVPDDDEVKLMYLDEAIT